MRFVRWLDDRLKTPTVLAVVFVTVIVLVFTDGLREIWLEQVDLRSECLTREEMTTFIRRHHTSDHPRTSGLRSLSAKMGLMPPGVDIDVNWGDIRPYVGGRSEEQTASPRSPDG